METKTDLDFSCEPLDVVVTWNDTLQHKLCGWTNYNLQNKNKEKMAEFFKPRNYSIRFAPWPEFGSSNKGFLGLFLEGSCLFFWFLSCARLTIQIWVVWVQLGFVLQTQVDLVSQFKLPSCFSNPRVIRICFPFFYANNFDSFFLFFF